MRNSIACVLIVVSILAASIPGNPLVGQDYDVDGFHTWTNRQGQSLEAKFLRMEGDNVILERKDGKRYPYPANNLDLDSQNQLNELKKNAFLLNYPPELRSRCSVSSRTQAIKAFGGDAKGEAVALKGLEWLAAEQDPDTGAWGAEYYAGMTGLSLLAFLAHCETPESPKWGDNVIKGAMYLMDRALQNDGFMHNGVKGSGQAYEHAIATFALAELYLMSKGQGKEIPQLDSVLKKAIEIITDGQTQMGGWAYYYNRKGNNDMSLSGWQMQALRAALGTGINVKEVNQALDHATEYVKAVQDDKGAFRYNPGLVDGKSTLTGAALLHLRMHGEENSPEYKKGLNYLIDVYANPVPGGSYYAPY